MADIQYLLIISVALLAIASPGPATLAISSMSMDQGRRYGLALAFGVLTGSLLWSVTAAFGLGAIMYANAWLMEVMRYLGAAYLLYLSYKSMRSALRGGSTALPVSKLKQYRSAYVKGLLIHLTNPKAILFFGSLYSLGVSSKATVGDLLTVILTVGCVSATVFLGYAFLFSSAPARKVYVRSRRVFESVLGLLFGLAAVRVLMKSSTG